MCTGGWQVAKECLKCALVQGSSARRAVDVGLGIAIPVHSHVALNSVISDYVPKSVRGKRACPLCCLPPPLAALVSLEPMSALPLPQERPGGVPWDAQE